MATPSVVRSAAGSAITNGGTAVATLGGAPASSSVIVACGVAVSGAAGVPTGTGHSFTALYGPIGVTNILGYVFVSNAGGSGTAISWTGPGTSGCSLSVLEVSLLDIIGDGSAAGGRGTTPQASGTVATTNGQDLVVDFAATISATATTTFAAPGAGWTTPINVSSSVSVYAQILSYQIASATGSFSFSQTTSVNTAGAVYQPSMFAIKALGDPTRQKFTPIPFMR